jgi:glycosyltransferase involved in cell wall biosynthesis
MRICMLTSAPMPPTEGIGHYVWNLSRFLVERWHQVQIITRGQRGEPVREQMAEISVWRPRFFPIYPFHVHLHRLFVQRLVWRLESEIDIFHLHSPLVPPIHSKRPILVTAHTSRVGAAKVVSVTDSNSLFTRLQVPVSIQIERRVFATADEVVTVAQSVAAELQDYELGEKCVAVLGNGVDTAVFCAGEQDPSAESGEKYVLAVGRLDARKGFEDLVEAMGHVVNRFPNVRLYISGTGPLEERLRAKVEQMALEQTVRFLGYVRDRDEMVKLYRGATLFAHAARYEGLPSVLLEAMACEKAIVSTAVSGALDVMTDGVNGLLVNPMASGQLAEAICRLLGDAALRARLGKAARQTVEDRCSWQSVCSDYLSNYQALLGRSETKPFAVRQARSTTRPLTD